MTASRYSLRLFVCHFWVLERSFFVFGLELTFSCHQRVAGFKKIFSEIYWSTYQDVFYSFVGIRKLNIFWLTKLKTRRRYQRLPYR